MFSHVPGPFQGVSVVQVSSGVGMSMPGPRSLLRVGGYPWYQVPSGGYQRGWVYKWVGILGLLVLTFSDCHRSERYASYRNAFLFK